LNRTYARREQKAANNNNGRDCDEANIATLASAPSASKRTRPAPLTSQDEAYKIETSSKLKQSVAASKR